MDKICVLGLGYIGLPTAALFAQAGFNVLGVDINAKIVSAVNEGRVHIEEEGLAELVGRLVKEGRLRAALKPEPADAFLITVPTPLNEDRQADLSYVVQAVEMILPHVAEDNVIILESTVPPRTVDDLLVPLLSKTGLDPALNLHVAHCPERVLPGRILEELIHNNRIVGGYTPEAARRAASLYRRVVKGEVLETKALTAEMTKLMENTYRDVNIALANELVKMAASLGVDALEVIRLANQHPRVNLHAPGPGVGGHCIAVDPYFIVEKAPTESVLIQAARQINESMPAFVTQAVKRLVPKGEKIAIFGLAYKGNVADTRESPSFKVMSLLKQEGYELAAYDPHVVQEQVKVPLSDFQSAVEGASCLLVLTDHREFVSLDEEKLLHLMRRPLILDTRNCVQVRDSRIHYVNYNSLHELQNALPPVLG